MDKQTRKGYVKMAKRKTSFTIYPTYSDIFKNGQEEIVAHLSTEGVAENILFLRRRFLLHYMQAI